MEPKLAELAPGDDRSGHIMHAVFNEPWAIKAEMYAVICEIVQSRLDGGPRLTAEEIQARIGAPPTRRGAARSGAVAVIPLYGVISQRMNMMTNMSGGTSTELFGKAFKEVMADPSVGAVVLDVDSPGGSVFGIQELWQTIMDARGKKPVVAVANSLMASAAYYISSAADEIVVTPGGEVGSIGILTGHEDVSGAREKAGIKTTLVSAGRKKLLGNPFEPLTDEAIADLKGRVDTYYSMFVDAVARGRGVSGSEVRNGFGEGGTVLAREAVQLGMADRTGTLDRTIERLLGNRGAKAQEDRDQDRSRNLNRRRSALL